MKRILRRSTLIFAVALAFICGTAYFAFLLVTNADNWMNHTYNYHISGSGGFERAGKILDRNGNILAQTVDGERVYNDDLSIRTSLLHVVGDESFNISTSVQSMYRSDLIGYSFIWGLNMPESLSSSNDIELTVDAKTCAAAYDVLNGFGKSGACVIYNYKTGEVICSVSTLSYDPENPPKITEDNEDEYDGVYLDRAVSSTYTPGSIFKIITSAAAIENISDIYDRTWYCSGREEIGGSDVTCVSAHGTVNFEQAMACSCNIVYAELAVELGADIMTETADKAGINSSFKFGDLSTAAGHYDVSEADKNQLAWSGVGQYNDQVNPLQMAVICGAIASGGSAKLPYLIQDTATSVLSSIGINNKDETGELFSADTAEKLDGLMRYTIQSYYGDNLFGGLTVCAKTGTAEVGEDKEPNAWMVGYAQDEDCPLAFACVVEDSGYGITYAGAVAEAAMIQAAKSLGASAVR